MNAMHPSTPTKSPDLSRSDPTAAPDTAAECVAFGRIAFVSGSQVVALMDESKKTESVRLQMGALVKTESATSTVFGVVSSLSIPLPAAGANDSDVLTIEVELLGEIPKGNGTTAAVFRRGVSAPPQLNDPILTTTRADLEQVYAPPNSATARVGWIHQDRDVSAYIITNDLLGKHFAILGTTGCGKSCAATLMLHAVIKQNPESHIVLLDPHNEYASAFTDMAVVLDTESLELPYWMLEFGEFLAIIAGTDRQPEQDVVSILSEAIVTVKRRFSKDPTEAKRMTVDTPVPYRLIRSESNA